MVIFDSLTDKKLIALIEGGSVGVVPTDTVYGLVCQATNKIAVSRLYNLKNRQNKPGTLIAANINQLVDLGIPRRYLTAVEKFWPNPISIIIPTTPELQYLDQGKRSLPMRIPKDNAIQQLLALTGPLLTTSANRPGEPPATTLNSAQNYFGDLIDFYVEGGNLSDRQSSTIIRIIDDVVDVIRQGPIKIS